MADFQIPFSPPTAAAWDPTKAGAANPDPGLYDGKTTAVEIHEKDGGKRSLKLTVDLDGFGACDLYLGLDFSKEANQRKMKTAMIAHGMKEEKIPAALAASGGNITSAFFLNRPCKVLVKAVEGTDALGRPKLNDRDFITAEQAATYKAATKPQGAPAAAGDSVADLFG